MAHCVYVCKALSGYYMAHCVYVCKALSGYYMAHCVYVSACLPLYEGQTFPMSSNIDHDMEQDICSFKLLWGGYD